MGQGVSDKLVAYVIGSQFTETNYRERITVNKAMLLKVKGILFGSVKRKKTIKAQKNTAPLTKIKVTSHTRM